MASAPKTDEARTRHFFFTDRELDQDGGRKWPAWFTFEQMRRQLRHEIDGAT